MTNPNREFDKTHLSIDTAEERILVHRDYIAHCLRWSHVVKYLYQKHRYQTAKILDVGCGREMPLAKLLYSNRMSGAKYIGCDMNRLEIPEMLQKAVANGKLEVFALGETDASMLLPSQLPWQPNIITCFEVFEHVLPRIAKRLLQNLRALMADDGIMFFSTPNWNGSAAANHINETKHEAIKAALWDHGFVVEAVYGTFASQTDYKHLLKPEDASVFNRLSDYYDSNLLSVMLAPLYPAGSRNALWVCSKALAPTPVSKLAEVPGPWSQNPDWKELA